MRLRVQTDQFTTLLLAALGFAPIGACGGAVATNTGGDAGAGGTGGGIAAGGSTGSGGGDANPFPCLEPQTMGGGFVSCKNGVVHRASKTTCPSALPRPGVVEGSDAGPTECVRDSDCMAKPNGYCSPSVRYGGIQSFGTSCAYGCVRDEECEASQICVCGDPVGHCAQADCTVDAECAGNGFNCATYVMTPGCPSENYACQKPGDQCAADADCTNGAHCGFQSGHRACVNAMCVVGRPFLVDGSARMAPRGSGDAWQVGGAHPSPTRVSPVARARLAEEWTQVGLMEHASIAAFARFTLQLMSLGAPADLVERSNAAACDETLHAKLAFSIASTYAGRDVGPGPLDVQGALDGASLHEIFVNVIREGCIGETVAAVEAAEALEHAVDPAVRSALARIAEDELRHADLAWRFVRWAVETGGVDLRKVAWRELEAARDSARATTARIDVDDPALLAGGILSADLRSEVRVTAIERVVFVCARTLVGLPGDLQDCSRAA